MNETKNNKVYISLNAKLVFFLLLLVCMIFVIMYGV